MRRRRRERRHVSRARHLPNQARSQRYAMPHRAAACAAFRLNHQLARRIIQHADPDVVVRQPLFELLRDLRQHLVRIQRRNRISRNRVQQRQMPRLRPLFVEEPRVLNRDARLARQHPHQLQMPFVERVIVIRENSHRADCVVVRHQRHDADATRSCESARRPVSSLLRRKFSRIKTGCRVRITYSFR